MVALGSVALVCLLVACCAATNVQQCNGRKHERLSENVQLMPCKKPPCKLKKGTNTQITIGFTPKKDIAEVKNLVNAEVFGVPLPFIGVDGNSICDKIFTESGDKAECPVKADTKYVYKDSFPIQDFYPSIAVKVHWELVDSSKDGIICFEVPAKIE